MTSDDEREELIEYYDEALERAYGRRKWIVAMDVLAATRGVVERLKSLGAEKVLCVAASRGAGELPDPEFAPDPVVFDVTGDDMMSSIRASVALLADLPSEAITRIDAFDPDGDVAVIGTIFDDGRPVAGRRKYGARPAPWQALEDKTTVDELWDRIGVTRTGRAVVPVDDLDRLRAESERLDLGHGTVWVADNREGFHGGGSYARWMRPGDDAAPIRESLKDHAYQVRVMPFLEGIPCSIHGIVFDDRTIVLRPCEMLVFRRPDSPLFHYGKAATFWDPPAADRRHMRDVARRVGEHLRDIVDYRGAFTVDGVMTEDGFRPTELNPRFGAALGTLTASVDIPMMLMNLAIIEREPIDWRSEELERLLLRAADEERVGGTMAIVPAEVDGMTNAKLVLEDGAFRRAEEGEPEDASLFLGSHPAGGYLHISLSSERTPVGESSAPRAIAALQWADREYHLEIGRLEPARDVRSNPE